jgi:hypothetical protein
VKSWCPFASAGRPDSTAGLSSPRSCRTRSASRSSSRTVPAAGSIVGSDAVREVAPDGYTLLVMSNTHTVNETLVPKKPVRP